MVGVGLDVRKTQCNRWKNIYCWFAVLAVSIISTTVNIHVITVCALL